jgi:hypothetical protein
MPVLIVRRVREGRAGDDLTQKVGRKDWGATCPGDAGLAQAERLGRVRCFDEWRDIVEAAQDLICVR